MSGKFSAEFIDFVNNKCLVKNVDKRADAMELLAHPLFTRRYPDQDDLFDYYRYCYPVGRVLSRHRNSIRLEVGQDGRVY